jgi:hypothetical protein
MAAQITCDYCGKAIPAEEPTIVRADVTTFGPGSQPEGVPDTPQVVSVATERLDFHESCWPSARAKITEETP